MARRLTVKAGETDGSGGGEGATETGWWKTPRQWRRRGRKTNKLASVVVGGSSGGGILPQESSGQPVAAGGARADLMKKTPRRSNVKRG